MPTVPYDKPYQTHEDLYQHLKNRGLKIHCKDKVIQFIRQIGFHRFKIYCVPFRDHSNKHFHPDTRFSDIQNLYLFDEALRTQMFTWIQYIEIGIRTFFNETMLAKTQNPFWYLDAKLFQNTDTLIQTLAKIRAGFDKAEDDTCQHYKATYHNDFCFWYRDLPPSWMAFEYITLGNLTSLMTLLSDNVINTFKLNSNTNKTLGISKYRKLCNWIIIIRDLRNTCYHHSRLFSRNLPAPDGVKHLFSNPQHFSTLTHHNRLYTALVVMQFLIIKLGHNEIRIGEHISRLMDDFDIPDRIIQSMGFPNDWKHEFLFTGGK